MQPQNVMSGVQEYDTIINNIYET